MPSTEILKTISNTKSELVGLEQELVYHAPVYYFFGRHKIKRAGFSEEETLKKIQEIERISLAINNVSNSLSIPTKDYKTILILEIEPMKAKIVKLNNICVNYLNIHRKNINPS